MHGFIVLSGFALIFAAMVILKVVRFPDHAPETEQLLKLFTQISRADLETGFQPESKHGPLDDEELDVEKLRVLILCVHNSARSQMVEAFLNESAGDLLVAESAGFEPRPILPLVVEAMAEVGHDLSEDESNSVFQFYKDGRLYDYVITVCDESMEDQCPIFPGISQRLHWPFPDPAALAGDHQQQLAQVRIIRDNIRRKVSAWVDKIRRWPVPPRQVQQQP